MADTSKSRTKRQERCEVCGVPFPTMRTDNPDMPVQAVFAVVEGKRVCEECAKVKR